MGQKLRMVRARGLSGVVTTAALAVTGLALAAGPWLLPGGETALTRGIDRVIAAAPAADTPQPREYPASAHLWQSRLDGGGLTALAGAFAVGDRITVSGAAGTPRILEVTEVRAWVPAETYTERAGAPGLTIVTAVVVGEPHARPVRFVVGPVEAEPLTSAPKSSRTTL